MNNWHLARGFRFAGVPCGIRPGPEHVGRLDLALVLSDRPASAAGVFTQNRVCAAPVHLCRERLPRGDARGLVICSGNANACTGDQGLTDARRMARLAEQSTGVADGQFLVGSTGVIGRMLPMATLETGIPSAAAALAVGEDALSRACHAILTTDTCIKVSTRLLTVHGQEVRITGFAKGAAMIGPNMATMLAFVLTDAPIRPDDLQRLAAEAADRSFNCVSVEGHTSTNDSLIFLANGDGPPLAGDALATFRQSAIDVCADLARAIASDAEGADHLITLEVEGLRSEKEARTVAKAVADSPLVKTAIFGADPNWGRVVSAAGYSGVMFEERDLSLWLGDTLLYDRGTPLPFDAAAVSAFIKANRQLTLRLVFTLGSARCTFYTCDLTTEYVRLNADYTT